MQFRLLTFQSDNGKEFKGSVKQFCRIEKIRIVQSWPYKPRAQGGVCEGGGGGREGYHSVLRNKICFDMVTQGWSGTNCVKNFPILHEMLK